MIHELKVVEIEIFSYCNRQCWFCPNSFIDRKNKNYIMEEELYLSVMNQLKEIQYSGDVTYSRYNEPTSHRDIFLKRLQQARHSLPNANLKTNSNGDYISMEYLMELRDAGLNEIFLQYYNVKPFQFDYDINKRAMIKILDNIGLPYHIIKDISGYKIEYMIEMDRLRIQFRSRNFISDGSSRGNTIPLATNYIRTKRCLQLFHNMYIDYNGNVMVCCALRSDIPEHSFAIMGNIKKQTISEIFNNEKYTIWRKNHLVDGPKVGVCRTCKNGVIPEYENNISFL